MGLTALLPLIHTSTHPRSHPSACSPAHPPARPPALPTHFDCEEVVPVVGVAERHHGAAEAHDAVGAQVIVLLVALADAAGREGRQGGQAGKAVE